MLFDIPIPLSDISGLYRGFHLILWWIAVAVQLGMGILIALKGRSIRDVASLRSLTFGFAFFAFALAGCRIFFIIAYITPYYESSLSIGYVFAVVSLIPVIAVIEKYIVKQTKFVFSIISCILAVISIIGLFFQDRLLLFRTILQIASLLPGGLWFVLYIWLITLSTGEPRKKAIITVIGVFIALMGFLFDAEWVLALRIFPLWISPLLYICGSILVTYIMTKKSDIAA
jgi:hypothetical protein